MSLVWEPERFPRVVRSRQCRNLTAETWRGTLRAKVEDGGVNLERGKQSKWWKESKIRQ